MEVCVDIKTLLTGITSEVHLYNMPADPDNFIGLSLTDDAGEPQHTLGNQKPAFERPQIEVLVRHTSSETAMSWLESIKDALDGKTSFTINGHYYISCMQDSDIVEVGRDERNRIVFYIDFNILVVR